MKALIIDSHINALKEMDMLIRSMGHETFLASGPREGLDVWKRELPHVIMVRWNDPVEDSLKMIKHVREIQGRWHTHILLITKELSYDRIGVGLDAGGDDFIISPFTKEIIDLKLKAVGKSLDLSARDVIIMMMANMMENRDYDRGHHLVRIQFYSRTLAKALAESDYPPEEIDQQFIQDIFFASVFHDVGKIGIPDHILLKEGRLNEEDYEIMKSHSRIGYEAMNNALEILPNDTLLKMCAEISLCHHERFDGSGYPDGLQGNDIPISARIISLADVYDALINKKMYKKAYSHNMAKTAIINNSGTHFDPAVVGAFISCEKKFDEISSLLSDDQNIQNVRALIDII